MDRRFAPIHESLNVRAPNENPFDLQKASHYSSEEILGHWVDIASQHGGLVAVLCPAQVTPMFLLGGKGSGKTHLMRYCSAPVQAARHGNLHTAILKEKYAGVYVPAEGLNTPKFSGKGLDDEVWATAFSTYFETWLATSLLGVIKEALGERFEEPQGKAFSKRLRMLFDVDHEFETLAELEDYLVTLRRRIDYIVNNSAITRDLSELVVPFSVGSLIFGIPDLVAEHFVDLKNPLFVYLIDELENFTAEQQKFLNTLIRYRRGRSTIKVGARLYGVRTYETLGSGEPIKLGAEYQRVQLDDFLREHDREYKTFAVDLTLSRLRQAGLVSAAPDATSLSNAFETIDRSNYSQAETIELMQKYDQAGQMRPHLRALERKLLEASVDEGAASGVVELLTVPDHPLFEKCNTFSFIRKWSPNRVNPLEMAKQISDECLAFRNDRKTGGAFKEALLHFSSDLLAQMYRESRRRQPHAGLDDLVELSQGIPRNLLGILSHVYRRAQFAGERPFGGGKISVNSQTDGVIEGSRSFRDDAQPDAHAADVRDAVEGLALLFRSIRFSDAPSECDVCTFSVNPDKLTEQSRVLLRTAENWSHLVRIRSGSKNKNSQSIDWKFQFAPMLAPLWELSQHRRGSIELKADLANAIFDPDERSKLVELVQDRVSRMNAPRIWGSSINQAKLF